MWRLVQFHFVLHFVMGMDVINDGRANVYECCQWAYCVWPLYTCILIVTLGHRISLSFIQLLILVIGVDVVRSLETMCMRIHVRTSTHAA